ncbi:MAG: Aspartyl/glutamyl-tRNA(Asn/Gln) amidotransferase subunit C [Candidatus Woesebacteria bacterium GW2011_GWA2_40_7b]|uniref:Aspartyl/glutamyl-tRNA(Asn/Gln) amidotransferase subunit C n=1 Tax=Candidatus Woesebacteria bacterium GW2011_GWA2_40_7b TaxID=1618563 RepID=A0A0G0SZZ9_9BACT|nr:MAG: Aspartyl/glutamyl-tRNA(Asn/Gln) amidotransferase subunit C [Candidatus Woesebacteria bacterium GW2011_GWA2_40_7b]
MAKLTKTDVLHIAELAKLDLTEDEVKKFVPQLSTIVDYIGNLSKIDTSKVDATSQTTGLVDVFREDRVVSDGSLSQDEALSGTEETYNGYFKVGAILTERTDK